MFYFMQCRHFNIISHMSPHFGDKCLSLIIFRYKQQFVTYAHNHLPIGN